MLTKYYRHGRERYIKKGDTYIYLFIIINGFIPIFRTMYNLYILLKF